MSSSHICQVCRRRLGQIRPRKLPQWQQRANFISLSKSNLRTTTDETERGKDDILNLGDDSGTKKGKYATLPERRRPMPRPGNTNPGDVLESLFEQSITESVISENATSQSMSSLDPYKKVETLLEMMKRLSPPADSFHFFVQHFGPDTEQHGSGNLRSGSPSYLQSTARKLLRSIIIAKTNDPFSTTLPSVTELSSVYLRLGMLLGTDWSDLMVPLIKNIIELTEKPIPDSKSEHGLLSDLLGAWNVVCRNPGDFNDLPEDSFSQLNWSHIPPLSSKDAIRLHRRAGTIVTFGMLTPSFGLKHLDRIPSIALSTFHLLNSRSAIFHSLSGNPSRFMSALSRILSVPSLNLNGDSTSDQDEVIAAFINKHLATTKKIASQATNSVVEENTKRRFANPQTGFNMGLGFVNKRLHEAMKSKNRHQVDELWSDVVQWPIATNQIVEEAKPGTLSAHLCNYFILVYMALRQPNRAIDVWNHMVQNGLSPTLATWDSMMSGCKAARDGVALEGVWRKMQMARVEPDIYCWTTRISGLMASYQLDAAVRALDEMGRKWLDAAKKQHPKLPLEKLQKMDGITGAVKPTIETINAAILGALRQHKPAYAQRILAWGGSYGLTPDVRTYNILLKPLLNTGQTQQAMGLLQQMQQAGVEADITTYTTILDETFRFAEDLSSEEQKAVVFGVFDEMEQAGLRADLHTYGRIIYSLLQSSSKDMTVANIVLERMAKLNIEPSVHIYTSLVQHYFNQDPPQLDAARSTIERASMVIGSTDHIFWDRVVEGYSRAGETAAALRVVGKVHSTDSRVGWLALRELLRALARNEEWDMAKSLVRDATIDTGGPLSQDEKGKEGQHKFWDLAHELRLLDSESARVS